MSKNNNKDMVNHPDHYKIGGIETIDYIEAKNLNYRCGNAIKYITRHEHKGKPVEDLRKAIWYLERELLIAHGVHSSKFRVFVEDFAASFTADRAYTDESGYCPTVDHKDAQGLAELAAKAKELLEG